jgi:hypothetical protein
MFQITGGVAGLLLAQQNGYGITGQLAATAAGALVGGIVKGLVGGGIALATAKVVNACSDD